MTVDTNTMVSITEANQNFSKVARLVDELLVLNIISMSYAYKQISKEMVLEPIF